jgi:uncharacterized YccA/Bax inhibitor family protein
MRTSNPALNEKVFSQSAIYENASVMTLEGTINKSFLLILLLLLTGSISWYFAHSALVLPMMFGGLGLGLILGIVTSFKPVWSPYTAPAYALAEGLFLGAVSAFFEAAFSGIVMHAILLTAGVFISLLLAYKSGWIKATENFRLGVVAATGAVALIYLISVVLNLFGIAMPYIHDNGPIGIIFSVVVVAIAALNLVLDFDFIENGAKHGAPKYMEWYAAFGLLVTLVWLYIEILKLLSKLRSR